MMTGSHLDQEEGATLLKLRHVLSILGLAILVAAMIMMLQAMTASAGCTPPGSGDWTVTSSDACDISGTTLTVNGGDLIIEASGNLTLRNVVLQMNGAFNGDSKIVVEIGGTFNAFSGTNITTSTGFNYSFVVDSGAFFNMDRSTVKKCGYGNSNEDAVGLRIESDSVVIKRSTFVDNYAGLWAKGVSPSITNSSFSDSRFGILVTDGGSPHIADSDITSNVEGLYSDDSTPKLINNDIKHNTETGVFLVGSNAYLNGNVIQDSIYGIGMLSSSPTILNNNISFNFHGIRAFFGDPIIENNEIEINTWSCAFMAHTGGRIKDNDITGSLNYSIQTWYGVILHGATTAIQDNRIYYIQLYGIKTEAQADVKISGNDMQANYAAGIWIESSSADILDNNISHSYYGLSYQTMSGLVKGNTFFDDRMAIDGAYANESLVIEENLFLKDHMRGVSLYDSHPIIRNNTFHSIPRGIRTIDSRPQVIGNTFYNISYGIELSDNSDVYFADNDVKHGNYTIFASESRVTLVNNTIQFSANYSAYFCNGSYGLLINNVIKGNQLRGVYFLNSDGHLINNIITESGTGIYSTKATIIMENNTISKTAVALFLNRTDLTMKGDIIDGNSVFGIIGSEGTFILEDVLINNSKDGLYINTADVRLRGCTISNGTKGLSAFWTTLDVYGSSASNIEGEGIYVVDSTATIRSSRFENDKYAIRAIRTDLVVIGVDISLGEYGMDLQDLDATIEDSSIEDVNNTGINAMSVTLDIRGSRFVANRNGLMVENSSISMSDSEVLDNTDMGINIYECVLHVKDTRFIRNLDGIFDLGHSSIFITDCNMSSNEVYGLYTTSTTKISNINITRRITLQDNSILLKGVLKVKDQGTLILLRSPLEFFTTGPGDASAVIMTGGKMEIIETILSNHYKDFEHYKIGYSFTAETGSGLKIVNSTIKHCGWGLSAPHTGMLIRTQYTDITTTLFENNSVGLYIDSTSFNGTGLRFKRNNVALRVQDGYAYIINSTVEESSQNDVYLSFSTLYLLNTDIAFSKAKVNDEGSLLVVMWYLHVSVVWDDGQPIVGAHVSVTDKASSVLSHNTDDQGYVRWLVVKEYLQKGPQPTGYFAFAPLRINATEKDLSVERSDYISATTTVTIMLKDDSPPVVDITSPSDGSVHYNSNILAVGTAIDTASEVLSVEVSIDGVTWLPANGTTYWALNLTVPEGGHSVQARATDARGNVYTASISIEVDLTSPMLEIYAPDDGHVTNQSTVTINGRVHVGTGLIINDVSIGISNNGTFNHTLTLVEGGNPIHIKAVKNLETIEVRMMVFRDTVTPAIYLRNPTPGEIVNRSLITVTVASDEEVSFIVGGQPVDTFGGEADVLLELQEGTNVIVVRAVDRAGNMNETQFLIELDVTEPEITLFRPRAPAFSTTKERLRVEGRTEPGTELTMNGEPVEVGPDGNFSVRKKLHKGKNIIILQSRDKANNTGTMVLDIKRKEVEDNTDYMWLVALAIIVGAVLDLATVIYFNKYYRPKERSDKGDGEGPEDDDEDDEDVEEDGEEDVEEELEEEPEKEERVRPRRPTSRQGSGPEGPGSEHSDETEFEELEDLGEF